MFRVLFILTMWSQIVLAQESITVNAIYRDGEFASKSVPGFNFLNDGRHYTKLTDNKIESFDLENNALVETLFDASKFVDTEGFNGRVSSYRFSEDESAIVIATQKESIYRRSSKARYYIFDRMSGDLKQVFDQSKQMYATLSPDKAHVAFVVDNNLYIKHLGNNKLTQVTTDGEINAIINGGSDWVYEEEFSLTRSFEWSPDGKRIAFLRFDERDVPEFTMTNYHNELYPEFVTYKYPKVGEKLSKVEVKIYELNSGETKSIGLSEDVVYIPRMQWMHQPGQLCITTLNRHQNHLQLIVAHAESGKTHLLLEEKNKYYVDIHDDLKFLDDGKHFIWSSEKSGYTHYYLHRIDGREVDALTKGDFDVTSFYGLDEEKGEYYYQAADESPMTRNIYRGYLKKKDTDRLNETKGWNTAQFSPTFDYYVLQHSTINSPPTFLLYSRDGAELRSLESNEHLYAIQKDSEVSPVEFFSFKTTDGTSLNGYMIKPTDFDKANSYPVFMYEYGGPNSQKVIDKWQGSYYWWFQLLAQKGYIIACVDNRGTGARGEEFRKMTYQQLGHYETIDQIEAAKYLGGLSYVDKERIGIFGWSYGGYLSSLALFKGNDVFKMGIAVAPVANWRWYDAIYTERFMRTEEENPTGYKDNSPVYFAGDLKGKYLLVHGGSDDNVHLQNSMELAAELIRNNKQFDVYIYPNSNHGIYHNRARPHLFAKMTSFIEENL